MPPVQLSDVVAAKVAVAAQSPGAAFSVIFAGQEIVGAVLSFTVITLEQVLVFPQASVALHKRVNV